MAADDCYELGRQAYNQGDHYHAILWMQQALESLSEGRRDNEHEVDQSVLLDYLSYSVYMQGNVQHALNLTISWLKLQPDHQRAQNNKRYYEQMIAEEAALKGEAGNIIPEFKNERPSDSYRSSPEFTSYESLCRGETTVVNPTKHLLTCTFRRHHPMFYIRPLKEETMHHNPWIAIYHDVLTDGEIAKIKELASPRLQRSGVFTYSEDDSSYTRYRTSKSAWLNDYEDVKINSISLRSGALSNLSLETVEQLQVVNYGIGGHYEPHYDFARPNEMTSFDEVAGNRIATVIFYMSDVEAGGATVFPELGVKLWPEKGACAVWYNLKPDGSGDYLTRHAACPVLTGSKWVCNKWFHERGQEFVRPCDLRPNS